MLDLLSLIYDFEEKKKAFLSSFLCFDYFLFIFPWKNARRIYNRRKLVAAYLKWKATPWRTKQKKGGWKLAEIY